MDWKKDIATLQRERKIAMGEIEKDDRQHGVRRKWDWKKDIATLQGEIESDHRQNGWRGLNRTCGIVQDKGELHEGNGTGRKAAMGEIEKDVRQHGARRKWD
jgi:hypothetical protein